MKTLSDAMDFDHIIRVTSDGTITEPTSAPYAPSATHDETHDVLLNLTPYRESKTWSLLTGFTGQYGYDGAVMHASEYIGGGLEAYILTHPGLYVALTVEVDPTDDDPEPFPAGWCIAYIAE